jgi:hypothetical protein
MLNIDTSDLDLMIDDFIELVDEDIHKVASVASKYAVYASPVSSGLFKANWNVSIDKEYSGQVSSSGDARGTSALGEMISNIDTFTLKKDSEIFIQNNVSNEDSFYAQTVSFDETGGSADRLISKAITTASEAIK